MRLQFIKKQHEVGEIYSYFFEPTSMPPWQAGQYLNITMPGLPPVRADRILTIASAPHEPLLQVATIVGPSDYKQTLHGLAKGVEVQADQLGGDFTYDSVNFTPSMSGPRRLFIAGGIGVTPYLSIIRDRLHRGLPINATLLYAGKDIRRPFLSELEQATEIDSTLDVRSYSDTRLTLSQLQQDVIELSQYTVYLAGSQRFSEEIGEGLVQAGHPRSQIKYDYFDGYVDIEY